MVMSVNRPLGAGAVATGNLGDFAEVLVGTLAARPAASTVARGVLYFASDAGSNAVGGKLYLCAGTAGAHTWRAVSPGAWINSETYSALPWAGINYCQSGATVSSAGLVATVGTNGVFMFNSRAYYDNAGTTTLALTANATNNIWATPTVAGDVVTGMTYTARTDSVAPGSAAGPSVLLAQIVTNGVGATTTTAGNRGVLTSGKLLATFEKTTDTAGAGDVGSITILGDGQYDVELRFGARVATSDGAAATAVYLRLWDGAGETGNRLAEWAANTPSVGSGSTPHQLARIPAFVGSKKVFLSLQNSAGTPSLYANTFQPAYLRAYVHN